MTLMRQPPKRAADATTKLARGDLHGRARQSAAAPFLWPAPPYYEVAGPAPGGPEAGLIVLKDGTKATGTVHHFSPEELLISFQQTGAAASLELPFSGLVMIELLQPLTIRRQTMPADMEQMVFPVSDRQPFIIDLASGKKMQGDTVGFIEALCGVFLFIPEREGSILRQFVPAAAIRSYSIGKPIGQLIVEEKIVSADVVDAALEKQVGLRTRRFGEYLVQNEIVSPDQLNAALKQQRAQPVHKLGDVLVELGYLSASELDEALKIEERDRSLPLGAILAEMGIVDAEVLNSVMAKKLGIPFVNLRAFDVAPKILERIPAAIAHRYQVLPLAESDSGLVIATDNPMNMGKIDELRFIAGHKLIAVMASAADLREAIERNYGPAAAPPRAALPTGAKEPRLAHSMRGTTGAGDLRAEELTARLTAESTDAELDEQQASETDTTLVQLVNKIIVDAVQQKASDIHIETNSGTRSTRVRFRKDGVLVTYLEIPAKFRRAVISRIKIMSRLDITERRKPQDGKIEFGQAGVELRVATIPTANNLEDVVMRVLSAATPRPVDDLGFDPAALKAIKGMMARSHGLFLVCGPTGSGKTTTLHSLLALLNTPELKIWTAEDPIEIVQPGLRQVHINPKVGWTFSQAMRTFMRGDPDVIMVGEMRDAETAKTAIEASLTGHLVLSTLHTNSAAESVVRLLDLGMDPFNFADALLGTLAQRLLLQLCKQCRLRYVPEKAELEDLAMEYCSGSALDPVEVLDGWRRQAGGAEIALYRAQGCERCDGSGYKGRIGVYELLIADPVLKRLVQTRAPIPDICAAAAANGMRLLKQDGITKILKGLTDIRQIRTV